MELNFELNAVQAGDIYKWTEELDFLPHPRMTFVDHSVAKATVRSWNGVETTALGFVIDQFEVLHIEYNSGKIRVICENYS
ncbi:hypothetical protein AU106_gp256 [Sinorhizobium phage phiM9]|uniref:Uncharacterized protein n=1 Tax=Sinorhizobium phage phiM9 TaxID=1636182 RepID=A0A0F6R565_9CAUD|nr:hypothetical protein AU106_gp256 [Sinorhizobium phage phiM9]AKE44887.1 hypothetical protein Sm_phiM9_260 [Sinorhizobium phage phiM9]